MQCSLCEVGLRSAFGSRRRRKYCDSCVEGYGRQIYNMWHRRAYQKKVGKEPEPIVYSAMVRTKERYLADKTERNRKMEEMRREGHSYGAIAKLFGITKQRVHKLIS